MGKTYKITEIVGTSNKSLEEAVLGVIDRAAKSVRNMSWFKVTKVGGKVENGKVAEFQVTLKIGFEVEE